METHINSYPYRLAELKDCGGDLSKSWYIEYYVYSEIEGDLIRKRNRVPPKFKTAESRRQYAAKEISETNEVLRGGFYIKNEVSTGSSETRPYLVEALQNLIPILKPELRPDTIDSYNSAINKLIGFATPITIDQINTQYVYRLRDYLLRTGCSAANTNNVISHLRAMFTRIMVRENLADNPFKIKFLQVAQASQANIAFTDEDREVLEAYLIKNDYDLYVLTRFIYYAFLRPKELRYLKVSAIRYQEGIILVPGDVSKNKKTEQIPIIKPLKDVVEKQFIKTPTRLNLFGKGLVPSDARASVNYAYDRHQRALVAAGLLGKDYTLYSWKHTGAVNAYLSGVGIKQLQLLLRHSTVQMTDIYLKSLGLRTDPNIENYNW
ncbi:site-specific integrase [Dyadobacter sp. 32]|uniref:tyrosine-type recombinase/integrase n=1 Tax=Dyadobacter sp. 32 TaxID=538966 RepID=UPI0011ED9200